MDKNEYQACEVKLISLEERETDRSRWRDLCFHFPLFKKKKLFLDWMNEIFLLNTLIFT